MTTTLQQAIEAIKAGDRQTGKELLTEVLRRNSRSEAAWLWMAYVVDSSVQRRECLARVLTINPNNENAWRGLSQLNRLPPSRPLLPGSRPQISVEAPSAASAVSPPPPTTAVTDSSPPAETTAGRSDRFWFWWVILFLLVTGGLIIGANLVDRWHYWLQFARSGVTTYATVIDSRVAIDGGYYAAYRFEVPLLTGGIKRIDKEEQIDQALYEQLGPDSLVRVQYLFDRPSTVRIQDSDNFDNLLYWTTLALLAAVATGLPVLIGAGSGFRRGWRVVSGFKPSFKRAPPKPKVIWEGEGPPPLKQWTGTYTLGQDNYEGFFIIETEDGIFLGEGGMEVYKTVPDSEPQQVTAFDVGVFDKTDITTLSKIVLSEGAYQDETVLTAIEANPHAEPVLAKPGAAFTMESKAMRIEARIDDMAYADGNNLYFDKLTVSLNIFVKEGVDLEQPMEIPDQFKEED